MFKSISSGDELTADADMELCRRRQYIRLNLAVFLTCFPRFLKTILFPMKDDEARERRRKLILTTNQTMAHDTAKNIIAP